MTDLAPSSSPSSPTSSQPLVTTSAAADDSLEARIARACVNGNGAPQVTSAEVARLIRPTEAALQAAKDRAAQARQRALDPVITASALAQARADMDDAAFQHERLEAALGRLRTRRHQLALLEEDARRSADYERLKAVRDQLAQELADVYPEFAARLGALLPRLVANNAALAVLNRSLPQGASPLRSAELVARGLPAFQIGITSFPSIVDTLRLPKFIPSNSNHPYHWPPR
jgi:hypothetical protein